jgi:hypothetical protein
MCADGGGIGQARLEGGDSRNLTTGNGLIDDFIGMAKESTAAAEWKLINVAGDKIVGEVVTADAVVTNKRCVFPDDRGVGALGEALL